MENALATGVGPTLIAYWAEEYERLFGPSGMADIMKSADQIPPDEMKKYVDNYNKWFGETSNVDVTKAKLVALSRLRDWFRGNLDTLNKLIKYMGSTLAVLVVMAVAGCQSGKYEIEVDGEVGSDSGWWEGSEPSKEGSVTFKFTVNEGSEAEGQDINVSLKDYVKGDERAAVFLGEAAIWR